MRYRLLIAPFACALLVLFMAFGTTAQGQKTAREPITAGAIAQSGQSAIFDELAEQASIPRYVDKSVIPTTEDAEDVLYYRGNGVGGGDMAEQEPNNTTASADRCLDVPYECYGTISYLGDTDFTSVTIGVGTRIDAYAFHSIGDFHTVLDPYLLVYTSDGTLLVSNDDIVPGNLTAHVAFVAPYTGTFYFRVASATPNGGSSYHYLLSVWPSTSEVMTPGNAEIEPNDASTQADPIAIPGVRVGNISHPGDADWSWFNVPANTTLIVDVHSRIYGMALDATAELYDQWGHKLWMSDDTDGVDPRFNVMIRDAGAYFLRVTDYANHGGFMYSYIVSVSPQDELGSPLITTLKYNGSGLLKQVKGAGFVPNGSHVEVAGVLVQSNTSANKPTTQIKVKPAVELQAGHWVTVVNPNGRRSNVLLP